MDYDALLELKAGTFSWSPRRHRLFETCRRAYFLRYYAANHGVPLDAPEILRLAFRLKHLKFRDSWAVEILTATLCHAKLQSRESGESEKSFFYRMEKEVNRLFNRGRMQLFDEEWRRDPKTLNLYEVYYRQNRPEDVFEQIWDILCWACEAVKNSELYYTLLETERIHLKYRPGPLSFTIGDFPVWLAAPFTVQRGPGIDMYIFTSGSDNENYVFQGGLYKIAAAANNWSSPDAARVIFARCADSGTSFQEITNQQVNISSVLDTVNRSVAEMRSLVKPGNQVLLSDFPGCDQCRNCRFEELCKDHVER